MSDDRYRDWTAAYVIGSLSPADRTEFEQHLPECNECRATILSFSPLPGLLGKVAEADLEGPPQHLRDSVVHRAGEYQARLLHTNRRWRVLATAAALVAVITAAVLLLDSDGESDSPTAGRVELIIGSEESVTGSIAVTPQDWGSFILIDLAGLPERDSYTMWAISDDGRREVAGTWSMADSGTCRVPGSTGIHAVDLARIVVTSSGDDTDELVWAS